MTQSIEDARAEYYRLVDRLDVGTPGWTIATAHLKTLRLAARALTRLSERECNGVIKPDGFAGWDDIDQKHADEARERAEKRVQSAIDGLFDSETRRNIEVEFQPDPRGPSVIINLVNGPQRVACFW